MKLELIIAVLSICLIISIYLNLRKRPLTIISNKRLMANIKDIDQVVLLEFTDGDLTQNGSFSIINGQYVYQLRK